MRKEQNAKGQNAPRSRVPLGRYYPCNKNRDVPADPRAGPDAALPVAVKNASGWVGRRRVP